MINNINNTTFSSEIYFLPKNELKRKAYNYCGQNLSSRKMALNVEKVHEGGLKQIKNIQKNSKGFTEGIIYCLGGVFKDGTNKRMYHFYPQDALKDMPQINKEADKIENHTPLKGVIIGGSYCQIANSFADSSKESLDLLGKLKKIFKIKSNKDFTIFYGQKNSPHKKSDIIHNSKSLDFMYDDEKDNYFIGLDIDELTPQNIKNYFKFIRISPNDKVFIGKEKINSKEIET